MAEEKIEIKKIIIKIGDVEHHLSIDQVKELHKVLDELFPKRETNWYPIYPYYPTSPYWWSTGYRTTTTDSATNLTYTISLNDSGVSPSIDDAKAFAEMLDEEIASNVRNNRSKISEAIL